MQPMRKYHHKTNQSVPISNGSSSNNNTVPLSLPGFGNASSSGNNTTTMSPTNLPSPPALNNLQASKNNSTSQGSPGLTSLIKLPPGAFKPPVNLTNAQPPPPNPTGNPPPTKNGTNTSNSTNTNKNTNNNTNVNTNKNTNVNTNTNTIINQNTIKNTVKITNEINNIIKTQQATTTTTVSPTRQGPLVELEPLRLGKSIFPSGGIRPLADVSPFQIIGGHVSINSPSNNVNVIVAEITDTGVQHAVILDLKKTAGGIQGETLYHTELGQVITGTNPFTGKVDTISHITDLLLYNNSLGNILFMTITK